MIYLIGGSSRSGKTILSKKLSQELGIPWISVDSLNSVIKPYLSAKLPFDQMWIDQNNDLLFERYSTDDLIQAGATEARALWSGVKAFIQHNILISQDYIIEGEQLLPELVSELKDTNSWRSIFLVRLDEKKTLSDIKQKHNEHDWLILHSKKEETLIKAAHMICVSGGSLKKEADKYGFPTIVIDDNFFEQINEAIKIMKK